MNRKAVTSLIALGAAASAIGMFAQSAPLLAAGQLALASGSILQTGPTQGKIHVISKNEQSWTDIQPGFGFVTFPVHLTAKALYGSASLNRVWVVQGNVLNLQDHAIYDSGSITGAENHKHTGNLTGGTLHLSAAERAGIVAQCNSHINHASNQQQQHEFDTQVPLTLVMQTVHDGGTAVSQGLSWQEDTKTTNFPVKVVCEPFVRKSPAAPVGESANLPDADVVQVELGLSTSGPSVGGTLYYKCSCPTGINLNMRWVTNIGTGLKSYVEHKDVAGAHNWTSKEFNVTTNEPAYGGNWKKELKDFVSIPFAAKPAPSGGTPAFDAPSGGLAFNSGGGSGGSGGGNAGVSYGATNTGATSGPKQYSGFFRLVAYKSKKTVPALNFDGSVKNKVLFSGKKMSGWRKYVITCQPKKSTVATTSPGGLANQYPPGSGNPDNGPQLPQATYSGELDLADQAIGGRSICPRQGQAVFKINSNRSSPIDYQLDCTGGRSWQGTLQMFANGANKYQGVAARTFDIDKTEHVACVLRRKDGGKLHALALKGRQYTCAKPAIPTPKPGLTSVPRPQPGQTALPPPVVRHIVRPARVNDQAVNARKDRLEQLRKFRQREQAASDHRRRQAELARRTQEHARRAEAARQAQERARQRMERLINERRAAMARRAATTAQPQRRTQARVLRPAPVARTTRSRQR